MEQHKAKNKKLSPNIIFCIFEASNPLFENKVYKFIRIRLSIHPCIHPSIRLSVPALFRSLFPRQQEQ